MPIPNFGSGTDPISLLILLFLLLCLLGRRSSKSLRLRRFKSFFLPVNTHRLTSRSFYMKSYFQNGGHDVRPPRCICSSIRRLSASPPRACDVIGSLYVLQFLIRTSFANRAVVSHAVPKFGGRCHHGATIVRVHLTAALFYWGIQSRRLDRALTTRLQCMHMDYGLLEFSGYPCQTSSFIAYSAVSILI